MGLLDKIKSKIETPLEVKQTRKEIIDFLNNIDNLATDIIKKEALKHADMKDLTVASIRDDGAKVDELAFILITNAIANEIQTGAYHTYRGVLGMVGFDMKVIWNLTIDELYKRGYYTKEKADEDLEWLAKEISIVG
jgi:hypothetical protein